MSPRAGSKPERDRPSVPAAEAKPDTEPQPVAPFLIAIALASFLLFSLELLAGRRMLPAFGGAPAVWTTSLCFFTAILFLGYLYAHLVASRLSVGTGSLVHASLAVAAILCTVIAPASVASIRRVGMPPALNVLVALTIVAGPAAFLLASTTPLLSAWYARGRHAPWWLYAASNAASFAALIAYPFAIAPMLSLSSQQVLLVFALMVYAAAVAWTIVLARGTDAPARQAAVASKGTLTCSRQAIWLLAAAVPAGLMSATTSFITTDLVAAPLIWIGPLGVYLASFVVAFSEQAARATRIAERLAPAAATALAIPFVQPEWPLVPLLATELAGLFLLSVAIHGRLAADRPAEAHLTRFYLVISLGGLLATAFVALVAPAVFSRIYEYPWLIAAGMVVLVLLPASSLPASLRLWRDPRRTRVALAWRLAPYLAWAGFLYTAFSGERAESLRILLLAGAIAVAISVTPQVSAIVTLAGLELAIVVIGTRPLHRERTFFGVVEVRASDIARSEFSGTTLHGLQFTDQRRNEPTTYYTKLGPLGAIFEDLRERASPAAIGVVGLGAGTIAAYAQPGDRLTFYEIDSAVIEIARNPEYFTYLTDAAAPSRIVAGDGRLSLEAEPEASFDLLILDAFTSDSVPAHLLTREAMEIYTRALRPGGVMAFHLSSRFYHLAGAVAATGHSLNLSAAGVRAVAYQPVIDALEARTSVWVVVGDARSIARFTARGWSPAPIDGSVLSDDFSDLTLLLIGGTKWPG
jgi:hypothetical protein